MKTTPTPIHIYFPTREEAIRLAYQKSAPLFTTWVNGVKMFSVRVIEYLPC
jgi:hypothetical protein